MPNRCDCGRLWSECNPHTHRSIDRHFTFYHCPDCLREWEVVELVTDHADPISSDEILSVHEALSNPLTMEEIAK